MPGEFTTFTDTPLALLDASSDGGRRRSTIQIAQIGDFKHPRYPEPLHITPAKVANWQRLLTGHFQGEIPIDEDHKTDKGVSSEASAWITGLDQQGDKVMANVEWTPKGEAAITERRYRYVSPTFVDDLADTKGESLGPALLRAALTNNPFLRAMPAISFSADPTPTVAERVSPPIADSPPPMPDFTKIATHLGLPAEADEAKILEAITQATKPPEPAPEPKTLDALATEAGKVLLSAQELSDLERKANAGEAASVELAHQKFTIAFDKALGEGRIDAKPETRERYGKLYQLDQPLTLETLENLAPVAATRPTGYGPAGTPGSGDPAPAHVDQDRHELHEQIEAYMAEHQADYVKAFSAVTGVSV